MRTGGSLGEGVPSFLLDVTEAGEKLCSGEMLGAVVLVFPPLKPGRLSFSYQDITVVRVLDKSIVHVLKRRVADVDSVLIVKPALTVGI